MNPVFPAQKRADQFSSMVEGSSTTQLRDTGKYADLVPLVGLVTSLRQAPAPEARPEFVSDLRSRLMLAAETALVPDTAAQVKARQPAPRRTGRERRLAVAIGGFALVSASASMSVAAQTALPGDTLYPLKRALENIHENVVRDADDKGTTMLDNASGRLDEVDELSRTGGQDPAVISQTLQDFTDQAVEGSDVLLSDYEQTGRLSSIEELRSFTTSSLEALRLLEGVVPVEARASLIEAARVLGAIDAQALTACPSCGTVSSVTDAIAADVVGPLYERLLEPVKAPAPPVRQAPQQVKPTKPTTSPSSQPVPTAQPPAAEPSAEEPPPPALPQGPGSDGGSNTGSEDSNPLVPLTTGLGDPLGDLLTSTTETLDELLTGGGKVAPKSDK